MRIWIPKSINRLYIRPILIAIICFLFFSVLVEYIKLQVDVFLPLLYGVFLTLLYVASFPSHGFKKNPSFYSFLFLSVVITIVRYLTYGDIEELLSVCLLSTLYIIVYNLDIRYQKVVLIASALSITITVLRAIKAMLVGSTVFAGNRAAILVAYFWCSLLILFHKRLVIKYGIVLIGFVHIMYMQSRTSLLAFCVTCVFVVYDDIKGTLSVKKLLLIMLGMIAVIAFACIKLDDINGLLFSKWNTDSGSSSSVNVRIMFWRDIFSHRTLIGLEPNYMMRKYGVGNCHNRIVQSYLQLGAIGFLAYVACQIRMLKDTILSVSPYRYYIVFSFVLSIMESNFWLDSEYPLYPFVLIACCGLIVSEGNAQAYTVGGTRQLLENVERCLYDFSIEGIGGAAKVVAA